MTRAVHVRQWKTCMSVQMTAAHLAFLTATEVPSVSMPLGPDSAARQRSTRSASTPMGLRRSWGASIFHHSDPLFSRSPSPSVLALRPADAHQFKARSRHRHVQRALNAQSIHWNCSELVRAGAPGTCKTLFAQNVYLSSHESSPLPRVRSLRSGHHGRSKPTGLTL